MTDKELLELAAKASGIKCEIEVFTNGRCVGINEYNEIVFDPLTDDGDALRLAVKLRIKAGYDDATPPELGLPRECGIAVSPSGRWFAEAGKDEDAATRRAIVRAAAEIGKERE